MRNLSFLLFSFLLLFSLNFQISDSKPDEEGPTYKFAVTPGEPASLNGSTNVQVANFEECVEKCETDVECILASQTSDDEPCNLFKYNTIVEVKNNVSGGEGMVAFKVYTDQPACELNIAHLLNGKKYHLYENDTLRYLWSVDTAEEGWTITYVPIIQDENVVCGNWSYARPYVDGCNPECLLTMAQVYAEPGPLGNYFREWENRTAANWDECMQICYEEMFCVVAIWDEGPKKCFYYDFARQLYFLNKTSADSGKRAAIKLNLNNETCKYTTDQLLKDTYFMGDNTNKTIRLGVVPSGMQNSSKIPYPFYRVRTTPEYYAFQVYGDNEQALFNGGVGCPMMWFDTRSLTLDDTALCYRVFNAPGYTYSQARQLCQEMGGDLLTTRFLNDTYHPTTQMRFYYTPLPAWGFSEKPAELNLWYGLEADPECVGDDASTSYCKGNQKWQWVQPSWPELNKQRPDDPESSRAKNIAFNWLPGQPENDPSKRCGYRKLKYETVGLFLDYVGGYEVTDCDRTDMDGFVCGIEQQYRLKIPKYTDVMASYGYERAYTDSFFPS